MSLPFIRKYQPKKISDIVGQNDSVKTVKNYIHYYKSQKQKCALLYGPSGTGKTSTVYCVGNELNLEIIEVNASDFRNKEKINSIIGNAINQLSLFGKSKLILIDEVDGLSGTKDRGATTEIIKIIKKSKFPVILTAQNPFEQKLNIVKRNSMLIPFKELDYMSVFTVLKKICDNEKITYEEPILKSLARMSGGDLRSAINDLEGLAAKNNSISREDIHELSFRDKIETMPMALVKVLKNSDPLVALEAFDNVKESQDDQFLWLDKNMPNEYESAQDRAQAYYYLSRADIFRRRIRRWQHWRFMVYINAFLTAGIATSKTQKYKKFLKYEPTGRILKMFWAKQKSFKKKSIAEKVAKKIHSSKKDIIQNIEYYKLLAKKDPKFRENFVQEFDLTKDEVAWMMK